MLYSNIGRFVVQRSQMYFQRVNDKKLNAKYLNWNISLNELIKGELESDFEFMSDIAKDPNSLDTFNDDTPMGNLLKRYMVQIEIWKNVLSLRNGKFYSKSVDYVDDNGIMGLHKVLSTYSWTYFDSPDMYHMNDEGNLLRKLLAVFSLRPTLIQVSTSMPYSPMGFTNFPSFAKATFIQSPICNVRLPTTLFGEPDMNQPVDLEKSLIKQDWFVEHKRLVPKNTIVIHSNDLLFFYINRRYQSPLANVNAGFRYVSVPASITGLTNVNATRVNVKNSIMLNNVSFQLQSVVMINKLLDEQFSTGCSALVLW
jgi:hypothetical protein